MRVGYDCRVAFSAPRRSPGSERRGEVLLCLQAGPEPTDNVVLMGRTGKHRDSTRSDGEDRVPGPVCGVPTPRTLDAAGRPVLQERGVGFRRQLADRAELLQVVPAADGSVVRQGRS